MSDWTGVYSTTESIKAGLDLEMPYVMTLHAIQQLLTVPKWSRLYARQGRRTCPHWREAVP